MVIYRQVSFLVVTQAFQVPVIVTRRARGFLSMPQLATDLCLSWPKVLNLVTVRGLMKTLV